MDYFYLDDVAPRRSDASELYGLVEYRVESGADGSALLPIKIVIETSYKHHLYIKVS